MKRSFFMFILLVFGLFIACSPAKRVDTPSREPAVSPTGIAGRVFRVFVVMDTIDLWSAPVRDGFIEQLDAHLAARGAAAEYTILDTRLDPEEAERIRQRIENEKPDIVCNVVYPSGFADIMITQKLTGSDYRFVSMNAVPVETGTIDSWNSPGGNVSGVGVFIQLNSALKLVKRIDPSIHTVLLFSWDQMTAATQWFETELTRACAEEGFSLEIERTTYAEDELALYERYAEKVPGMVLLGGISAFLYRDGTPADMKSLVSGIYRNELNTLSIGYEDDIIAEGLPVGTSIIWHDIGMQLADMAERILAGADPGSIPWEYPRKFNIILNAKTLARLGYALPQDLVDAAYRIYTDYDGNFIGKGK